MSLFRTLWRCALSPRLYKFYETSWVGRLIDKPYEPRSLEKWGNHVVVSFAAAWSLTFYTIPIIAISLYKRGAPLGDGYILLQLLAGAGVIFFSSLVARGYSRANNPTYMKFMKVLEESQFHYNAEVRQELQKYEFDFWAWPVDFRVTSIEKKFVKERITLRNLMPANRALNIAVPCRILAFLAAHTFVLKLIYPGSSKILNWAMSGFLLQGRIDLLKLGAQRYKLVTSDTNEIDTIFVDNRHKTSNGATLVITCEGNCGFYENGIISTPLKKGHSVLGWNHPGFGGSTGAPYPEQEENAIDCVMQFAIHELGFAENKIILYGWSIGGYTATWAAMNYPSIHSLVLDATFDDILPLALAKMPASIETIVKSVIRNYFNLNVAGQLNRYDGRVLIIRRTDDEMICVPENSLAGNRGNKLLEKLLVRRYPHLFSECSSSYSILNKYLSTPSSLAKDINEIDKNQCLNLISNDIIKESGIKYPSSLGQHCNEKVKNDLVLFLANKYMEDQNSQHCTPLKLELFHSGWDPISTVEKGIQ